MSGRWTMWLKDDFDANGVNAEEVYSCRASICFSVEEAAKYMCECAATPEVGGWWIDDGDKVVVQDPRGAFFLVEMGEKLVLRAGECREYEKGGAS